ncbi:RNA polymerase sigma factor [Brevibacillus brevis]|uniref:RNA polymerase sigma factor n=1 Tax=Brevibacillus brevis TaxID=1393 RepID=UPI00115950C7|nr:RNA polymerase sigma factor [Lysinibacillus sp. SDF0063]TQR34910.1 RNA polymerase sigma factor [Lysinibacillus sp. SDF0063]
MEEDQEWVKQVLGGDPHAFAHLVNKYKNKVCSLLVRMGNSPEDAEDFAQTAFVNAYKSLQQYDASRPFSAWLNKIAINCCLQAWRTAQKKNPIVPFQESMKAHTNDENPESFYLAREKQNEIFAVMGELASHYRIVLTLRYFEELSYQEIAETMQVPVTTVQVHLYRAKKKLRELMGKREELHEMC